MLVGIPKLVGIHKLVKLYSPKESCKKVIVSRVFQVLKLHYYSYLLKKHPDEPPCCAYCREPLDDDKIDKFNTLKQTKGTVIPCCESPQCILDGTTEGAKGGMKGWITKGRPNATPKLFRKRQKVADSDDVKMVTNNDLTKLKMRTSSRILAHYHKY